MRHEDYERRVEELQAYRKLIEQLRDQIQEASADSGRVAFLVEFILGIIVGTVVNSSMVDRVTNVIFCEEEAVKASRQMSHAATWARAVPIARGPLSPNSGR